MISLIILALAIVVALCFSAVILFGAPYLPTLKDQIETSLKLADLNPGDKLLELGCGDGRVVVAAAERGIEVIGYELNPILAFIAWARTRRFGKKVKIVCGDFWRVSWPETDAVFVFLLDKYMQKLDNKFMQYKHKPVKLVSFAFKVPGKKPIKTLKGVYLYNYK
jgi:SAM-dependent methyltransferase